MIVDDDLRRIGMIEAILTEAGYQVLQGHDLPSDGAIVLAHDSTANKFDDVLAFCVETLQPLVLYSESPPIAGVVERLSHGAVGYLDWPFQQEDAVQAIALARSVGVKKMALLNEERQAFELSARLTNREKEVLGYLAEGLTTKKMADKMGLSYKTVDIFRSRVVKKLGGNRAKAYRIAFMCSLPQ